MGTRRRRVLAVSLLFWFLMGFQLCASLNREGAALLKFKEAIDADPYGALKNWDEGSMSPCSWFGVECSDDGLVLTLILRNNSFYGIIPIEIGDLQDIKMLDLGYNNFSGPIPSELQNILSLEFLFLKGNGLSGGLPVGLNWLNRLPTARFATIKIRRLLVSTQKDPENINLPGHTGRLLPPPHHKVAPSPSEPISPPPASPTTEHTNPPHHKVAPSPSEPISPPPTSPTTEHTNPPHHKVAPSPSEPISPPPASPTTEHTNPSQDTTPNQENKNNSSQTIYASIGAAIGFLVVALSAVCFFYYCRRKTSTVVPLSAPTSSRQLQTTAMKGITLFRRSELETACEGFSNIIGTQPGFTLYKGTLPCGAEIAVVSTAVAYAGGWSDIAEAHYMNKVEALSKVNHKNLMNLVGYCEDEKSFIRMMVFEYVSNGSLFERLHVKEAEPLEWQSRLRIAMGVLYCLGYRHQQNVPVTLRNLNSSCIYLTEDNAAKVSDISFGIGKKEEDEDDSDAPDEYSTVYKFALLLLEMISGRCPYSDDDGLRILWAHRYLNGVSPVMGMVDPTLNSVPEEHVKAFSELIRLCISEDRRQRPTMAELTKRMQEITGITQDQAIPRNSALWWAELEIITA
nr:unnamed protein product [Digitaria exilis]